MSLFNSLFGSSEEKKETQSKINWIPLQHVGQLDEIVAFSDQKPAVIFKITFPVPPRKLPVTLRNSLINVPDCLKRW